jgi:hypothetical protein
MLCRLADLIVLPAGPAAALSDHCDGQEHEVAARSEQLADPHPRSLWSCVQPLADGEEIPAEVFLSLFRHVGNGNSFENVCGGLSRAAYVWH